jgi:hypothetical protein
MPKHYELSVLTQASRRLIESSRLTLGGLASWHLGEVLKGELWGLVDEWCGLA